MNRGSPGHGHGHRHGLRRRAGWVAGLVAGATLLGACDDMPLENRMPVIEATGTVRGFVYLDIDGSASVGPNDEPVEGLQVRLVPAGGGGPVGSGETDEAGIFRLEGIPVGSFRLVPDSATVPDSVQIFGLSPDPFVLAAGDSIVRNFRLSFPTYSLAEVLERPPGERVFTHGIALNSRVTFGDGVVHLREGDSYLRATGVQRAAIVTGDSVRFLGRTAIDQGRPVLHDVRPFVLINQAVLPQPVELTSGAAESANGGDLDAALVRLRNAVILDTMSVGSHFAVTVDDGSGSVDVFLRDFLQFDRSGMVPDSSQFDQATGLLVPVDPGDGGIRWRLTPRAPADLVVSELEFPEG